MSDNDKLDERFVALSERCERLERAVGTMADWLVQAQTGFSGRDAQGVIDILRGVR